MINDKKFVRESLNYKFMFQHFPKITLAVEDKFFSAKNHLSLLFHNNLGNDGELWSFWLYFMLILFKSRGYGSQLASKTASEASAFCKLQKIIFGQKWHF